MADMPQPDGVTRETVENIALGIAQALVPTLERIFLDQSPNYDSIGTAEDQLKTAKLAANFEGWWSEIARTLVHGVARADRGGLTEDEQLEETITFSPTGARSFLVALHELAEWDPFGPTLGRAMMRVHRAAADSFGDYALDDLADKKRKVRA